MKSQCVRAWIHLLICNIAMLCIASGTAARAEPRHALVVTNQEYAPELGPLAFPHSDGEIVSAALQSQGFTVQRLKDGSTGGFRQALQRFVQAVNADGTDAVVFFYFSGHAAEDGLRNYLILNERLPELALAQATSGRSAEQVRKDVDAAIRTGLPKVGVAMRDVTTALAALKTRARFVVIDSHLDRDEPLLFETGQILATQGRPGLNAADSNNYSLALSAALLTPGLDAKGIFRQVQVKVAEVTNGRQIPFFADKLQGSFTFAPSPGPKSIQAKADDTWLEEPLWQSVANSRDVPLLRVYLDRFPLGRHAAEARAQIEDVERLAAPCGQPWVGQSRRPGTPRGAGHRKQQLQEHQSPEEPRQRCEGGGQGAARPGLPGCAGAR